MFSLSTRASELTIITQFPTLTAARYAGAMIARQQGVEVWIHDEEGNDSPRRFTASTTDDDVARILHEDTMARLTAARDRLTFAIDQITALTDQVSMIRGTVRPWLLARLERTAYDLAEETISEPAFPRSCQQLAADSPAGSWYDDPWTDAMNAYVSLHEGEPEYSAAD